MLQHCFRDLLFIANHREKLPILFYLVHLPQQLEHCSLYRLMAVLPSSLVFNTAPRRWQVTQ